MTGEGFEPSTHGLKDCGTESQPPENKDVTNVPADACTNACTDAPEAKKESGFGEALALIARLPLSDAEKAEAVRRLLSSKTD